MSNLIIGLAGAQQVGKDTSMGILKEAYGGVTMRISDPMKEIATEIWGINFFNEDIKKRNRWILQELGRKINEIEDGIWIDYMKRRLLCAKNQLIFVPDIRYPVEARLVHDWGGIVVLVKRDTGIEDYHESEQAWKQIIADYEIDNNGSLKWLETQLETLLGHDIREWRRCEL